MRISSLWLLTLLLSLSGCGADSSLSAGTDNSQTPGTGTQDPDDGDGDAPGDNGGEGPGDTGSTSPSGYDPRPNNGTPVETCTPDNADIAADATGLGTTGADSTYAITGYDEDTSGSDLTGTWVIVARDNTDAPIRRMQKYFMVIISNGSGEYEMANCSAMPTETQELTWVDENNYVVDDDDPNRFKQVVTKRTYNAWEPFVLPQDTGSTTITLPLLTPSEMVPENGITLTVTGTSQLSSTDGVYQGLKLSTNTTRLGRASATINGNSFALQDVWCVVQSRQIEQQCSNDAEQPVPIVDSIIRASTEKWQLGVATSTEASWTNKFLLVARNVLEGISTDANSGVRTTATAGTGTATSISHSTSELQVQVDVGLTMGSSDSISIDTNIPGSLTP
ncbi:hypothetical protein [Venatoribacter cucullus]|uniref:hypothetical protein n=1 Tax=Venatoribacter cucullus TaxID=2661630 RepID=UPI0022407C8C|nr:hypothetical protein [Venatoribacter cucullus]UZK04747.1 hypothetical protein GAY96_12925 [Venatoribacter cucullus]